MRPCREYLSLESMSIIGIPRKFQTMSLNDFLTYGNKELEKVRKFIQDYMLSMLVTPLRDLKGLILFGSNGVGKTMLASFILREAYRLRYTGHRVTFSEYIDHYTRVWSVKSLEDREEQEDLLYAKYKAVDFLVLEEVGKEIDSKISTPILEDLLRYREDKGLVTIICANLKPSEIGAKYGESVNSLIQSSNMTPLKIVGKDHRDTRGS